MAIVWKWKWWIGAALAQLPEAEGTVDAGGSESSD